MPSLSISAVPILLLSYTDPGADRQMLESVVRDKCDIMLGDVQGKATRRRAEADTLPQLNTKQKQRVGARASIHRECGWAKQTSGTNAVGWARVSQRSWRWATWSHLNFRRLRLGISGDGEAVRAEKRRGSMTARSYDRFGCNMLC